MLHIVVRAGGRGTRLWPVSTSLHPKQFQPIVNGKSTFELSVDRVKSLVDDGAKLYVSTSEDFAEETGSLLGEYDARLIVEPFRRDTAAAVGLEAVYVYKSDPNGVIASLGSDHVVEPQDKFADLLRAGEEFLQDHAEYLLEIGVKPTYAETGFGYIHVGESMGETRGFDFAAVKGFKEKPELKVAQKYLDSGEYLWNANMFMWRADRILELFEKFQPEMFDRLMAIHDAIDTPAEEDVLREQYKQIDKEAIDIAIIEKADKMAALTMDLAWTDIGSFLALRDLIVGDSGKNLVEGAEHVGIDTSGSVVMTDTLKAVGTIGLENVAIVEHGGSLLVAPLDRVQEIKQIVARFEEKNSELV